MILRIPYSEDNEVSVEIYTIEEVTMTQNQNTMCGDCQNFKPSEEEKFFNCTSAIHAGVKYGMQVRADSRACDAFSQK